MITPKSYAQSLYESTDGKTADEVTVISKKFVEIIAKNNHLAKTGAIIDEFIKIWNDEKGIVEATVVSAKEMDAETVNRLNDHILKLSKAKEIVLKQKVDKSILGGVVIAYGDKIINSSLKTQLADLRDRMVK